MIRVMLSMVVRDGCVADFEREWLAAARIAGAEPGSIRQTLLRDLSAPSHYTICADWAESVHLAAYQRSPHRQAQSAALEPLRESATRRLLEVVAHLDSPTGRAQS